MPHKRFPVATTIYLSVLYTILLLCTIGVAITKQDWPAPKIFSLALVHLAFLSVAVLYLLSNYLRKPSYTTAHGILVWVDKGCTAPCTTLASLERLTDQVITYLPEVLNKYLAILGFPKITCQDVAELFPDLCIEWRDHKISKLEIGTVQDVYGCYSDGRLIVYATEEYGTTVLLHEFFHYLNEAILKRDADGKHSYEAIWALLPVLLDKIKDDQDRAA